MRPQRFHVLGIHVPHVSYCASADSTFSLPPHQLKGILSNPPSHTCTTCHDYISRHECISRYFGRHFGMFRSPPSRAQSAWRYFCSVSRNAPICEGGAAAYTKRAQGGVAAMLAGQAVFKTLVINTSNSRHVHVTLHCFKLRRSPLRS